MNMTINNLTRSIIGSAIEVHKELGPGLLESTYEACLFYELKQKGFFVEKQKILPVKYKEIELEVGYRIDLLVENQVLVELKSVKEILPIHSAQLLSYLKISNLQIGLLFNFNETKLVDGVKRIINS
jgi:GxxExxY protein